MMHRNSLRNIGRAFSSVATPHGLDMHATTILSVRKNGKVVMIGDGQVSFGATIIKPNARKVRRLSKGCIGGFAGTTSDALTLFERLENKLEEHPGQLLRACVELAKEWRTDKYLRRLEAMMIVADKDITLTLTGNGDVLEPLSGVMGIGSGGMFAQAAAMALYDMDLTAEQIAKKSMDVASDICIYTNKNFVIGKKIYESLTTAADRSLFAHHITEKIE